MNLLKFIDNHDNFDCSFTDVTSLKGIPKKFNGDFNCSGSNITSLEGSPKKVGGFFNCSYIKITSLEGAPEEVGEYFDCSYTNITSLEGAPKKCKILYCASVKITKGQVIDYLRHNDCDTAVTSFGVLYKKDAFKRMAVE